MKNLFSINKTLQADTNDFDATPYLAATVSDDVQKKLKSSFSVVEEEFTARPKTPEEKAAAKKANLYWGLCAGCLFLAFVLFFLGDKLGLYQSLPILHVADGGLLVASLVFNIKARRLSRRQSTMGNQQIRLDFSEATKLLEEAAAAAARELGVPEHALSVDILPYHYIIKGDRPAPVKRGRYDNLSVSLFIDGGDLCLATAQELFRIPLSHISGYRAYDQDFEIDMWLKPEESDSDKYRDFGIRKSGLMGRKCHGYVGLDIHGEYEILIPGYDFPEVKELLGLHPIA